MNFVTKFAVESALFVEGFWDKGPAAAENQRVSETVLIPFFFYLNLALDFLKLHDINETTTGKIAQHESD